MSLRLQSFCRYHEEHFIISYDAHPDNYGGTRSEVSVGVNWMYSTARNLSLELSQPIGQDRRGVQLEHQQSIMVSWRNAIF